MLKGKYLILEVVPSGLNITLNPDGIEELQDRKDETDSQTFFTLFEDFTANGWMSLGAEQIGALTSSEIIISPDAETDDHGNLVSTDTTIYWHERYQVEDAIEALLAGRLFLLKA